MIDALAICKYIETSAHFGAFERINMADDRPPTDYSKAGNALSAKEQDILGAFLRAVNRILSGIEENTMDVERLQISKSG